MSGKDARHDDVGLTIPGKGIAEEPSVRRDL